MLSESIIKGLLDFCHRWSITSYSLSGPPLQDDFRFDNSSGLPLTVLVTFKPTARWGLFAYARMERDVSLVLDCPVELIEKAALQGYPNWVRERFHDGLQRLTAGVQGENQNQVDLAQLTQQILTSRSSTARSEAGRNAILQLMKPAMPRDEASLLDIAHYAQQILDFVHPLDEAQWTSDTKTQAAVLYYIAVIGEAVKRLPSDFCDQHPDIPWADIDEVCNKVIHQYERVRLDVIWNTAQQDIPELLRLITPLLPTPPDQT